MDTSADYKKYQQEPSSFLQTYSSESLIKGNNLQKQSMAQNVDLTSALNLAPAGPIEGKNFKVGLGGEILDNNSLKNDNVNQLVSISKFSWKQRKSVQNNQSTNLSPTTTTSTSELKLRQRNGQNFTQYEVDEASLTNVNTKNELDKQIFEFRKADQASLVTTDQRQNRKNSKVSEFQKIDSCDLDIVELKLQKSDKSPSRFGKSSAYSSVKSKFQQVEKEKKEYYSSGEFQSIQSSSFVRKEKLQLNQLVRGSFVNSQEDQFSQIQQTKAENFGDFGQRSSSSPQKFAQVTSFRKDKQESNQLVRGSFADSPSKQFSQIQSDNFVSSKKFSYNQPRQNKFTKEKPHLNKLVRGSFGSNHQNEQQLSTKFSDDENEVITVDRSDFKRGGNYCHVGDVQYCRDGHERHLVEDKTSVKKVDSPCGLEISSPSSDSKDSDEQICDILNSYDSGSWGNGENLRVDEASALQQQVVQFNKSIVREGELDSLEKEDDDDDIAENFKRLYPLVKQRGRQHGEEVAFFQKQQQARREGTKKDEYRQLKNEEDRLEGNSDNFKQSGFDGLENEESLPDFASMMPNLDFAVTI